MGMSKTVYFTIVRYSVLLVNYPKLVSCIVQVFYILTDVFELI